MDIIDIHSHFFSRGFFDALSGGDAEALARVARDAGIALPPADVAVHTDRWLSDMDVHGVSRLVTFASVPEEVPAVRRAVARSGGRIAGCAFVSSKLEGVASARAAVEEAVAALWQAVNDLALTSERPPA